MATIFQHMLDALPLLFTWQAILAMMGGTAIGIGVGALPGLSATMGIAVLVPLTFTMQPVTALGMIAGIYNGAMYGGSIPAILLRIPGTPAGIATVFDGYPMAQKGQAKLALRISLVSSSIGSAVSAVALLLLAPPLSLIALKFSPANYFWLALFGLMTIAVLLSNNPVKGLLSACLGLAVGMVGIDMMTGVERFAFNELGLLSGVNIIVMLTGLYAIPPAIDLALNPPKPEAEMQELRGETVGFRWAGLIPVWAKSSLIGVVTGIIPALGGNIAALFAWNEQRRGDPDKDKYGKGAPEGIAAPECANNADTAATLIPALTLGIPGSSVAAIILGALLVHGLVPGPQLFRDKADITYGFMLSMLVTSGMMLVMGALGARIFVNVLKMPTQLLAGMILTLAMIGVYAIHNSMFEVWLMLGFGLVGYAMEKLDIPTAPAVLAMILGPIAEENLRRALLISGDSFLALVQGPISILLIVLILGSTGVPLLRKYLARQKRRQALAQTGA
ncbi:C4-dicarboxylate ABC transporter permease [Pacificitalea manganoxidans]|uniref:C4-dicarboxylate ABC transporter permease n=1 Tax=Pacificitalea manganoxidans TaxID=1411902 RepID=A0A291LYQ1_9RHOB|nr:tripartite tricarboxylate transporter permease [Pacificitalea manganoxidans]ATI41585.1 C4-dicarboxylate ABC transporter permease [Pacificitalea manganoxidans]MAQ44413.1 C4-dicarboxylate ABC transporter permease [Actibacterium sp.]MDR6309012.1 putative tricarboxylic transport membrane protein [Pacificitalea manganoxidans]